MAPLTHTTKMTISWRYFQCKSFFGCDVFPEFSWIVWYRPRPFCGNFAVSKSPQMQNVFFQTLCKIWCKSANRWRSGGSLITVNGIKWVNLQILFKTHLTSTSPCPLYFELETPFQLLNSEKTLTYWACIQFLKIFYSFQINTVLI